MSEQFSVEYFVKAVVEYAVAFFRRDLHIEVRDVTYNLENAKKLELRYLTSLLVLEGSFRLYLAFSFEKPLIEHAFKVYAEDIEVSEDEWNAYMEETAGDIINIVVGNATATLRGGPVATLSPPVVISEARSIFRHKETQLCTVCLDTDFGKMDICCIASKEFFNEEIRNVLQ